MATQEFLNRIKAEPGVPGGTDTQYTMISNAELQRLHFLVRELSSQLQATQIELEQLQAETDAYRDYISGKITLGQLEAALGRQEN